jgi:SAM-dependent methyltransferase
MTKQAEREYLSKIGDAGAHHSLGKPFSNEDCGLTLSSIGTVLAWMPPAPASVLDLGCGGGWTSVFFAKRGYDVVGQDIAPDMIDLAQRNSEINAIQHKASFVLGDYETLEFSERFDCAVFFDSLHHADEPQLAIACAYRALKSGGTLITHEPGEGHSTAPWSIQATEKFGVNERDMPPHLIADYARAAGFRAIRVFPMQHDVHEVFYGAPPPRLFSRKGLHLARRVVSMLFAPNMRAGAIVVMTK